MGSAKQAGEVDELYDEQKQEAATPSFDGKAFLDHLRNSADQNGPSGSGLDSNENTVNAGNTESHNSQRMDSRNLQDLFEVPGEEKPASTSQLPPRSRPASSSPAKRPPIIKKAASTNAPPKPQVSHDRNVSWGNDFESPALQVQKSLRNLNLTSEDALNPFEAEVETALLKAIDERQARRHPRSDTGTSTIFSQVPDDTEHQFVMENTPSHAESENNEETTSHSHPNQSRPLLKRSTANHNRTLSVEQTLFDLTTAFTAMNQHTKTSDSKRFGGGGPADEFAYNGLRLTESDSDTVSSSSTKQSRWASVKKNLPTLREENRRISEATSDESDDLPKPADRDDDDDIEMGSELNGENIDISNHGDSKSAGKMRKGQKYGDKFKDDWQKWNEFFRPHKGRFNAYVKSVFLYVLLPMTAIAAILFYFSGNPSTGTVEDHQGNDTSTKASASYILLFCCRQVITFSMAVAMQGIFIDFFALNTRVLLRMVGPVITLLIVQSKGWPHILFWWSIFDFAMVSGTSAFANHWLYYQDLIGLWNASNPSGQIANNYWYIRCLTIAVSLSIVVAVKRFLVGLYLGRQQFSHYGAPLTKVMNKMLLISEVASLAKHVEKSRGPIATEAHLSWRTQDLADDTDGGDSLKSPTSSTRGGAADNIIDTNNRDPLTGSLQFSEKLKLMRLLDQWEEPESRNHADDEMATISAVLQFRKALTFIQQRYPFSYEFGPADSREACVDSAQNVYKRLMKHSQTPVLQFDTIAVCALDDEGHLDQQKAKSLVKLFRPDRNGNLTMLDFVRSVDAVYKEFRLLQATIDNAARIDKSFEHIFNVVFYLIAAICILAALDFDPLALFLSLSSVILAFAFIIGSASAKYFEGVLFILARRPYGIGDLIQISNVEQDASLHGALPWCVENVTLFETVVCFLPTQERASLSNGSLSNSRVINWARSPQAQFHIFLNFPLDTPYEKVLLFKAAVEEYMKARPREWRALNGFRASRVVANENYIEWLIVIQHREPWQSVGRVLDSKANLSSFCQEVARQLDMQYQAPCLPVELRYADKDGSAGDDSNKQLDAEALTQEFQTIAREKHQIRVC